MATTTNISIQVGDEVIELKGAEKEAFLEQQEKDRNTNLLFQNEYEVKQDARESAITKLKALGLTESEAKIIIGLE